MHLGLSEKEAFLVEGTFDETQIAVGAEVPMMDAEGNQMYGLVLEVSDKHVSMDFNHPLAGHDLHFIGEILNVRNATPKQIMENKEFIDIKNKIKPTKSK